MGSNRSIDRRYDRRVLLYDNYHLALNIFKRFVTEISGKNIRYRGVIVTNDNGNFGNSINLRQIYSDKSLDFEIIPYSDVYKILGTTLDILMVDMREEFDPNKVCILFESVRGGGLIFIIGLKRPQWLREVNKNKFSLNISFHDKIEGDNSQWESKFLQWFVTNLTQDICLFNESDMNKIKINFDPMPFNIRLEEKFGGIDVSAEQKSLIERVSIRLADNRIVNQCTLVIANRGRGKSVAGGIILAQYIKNHPKARSNIVISAADIRNVQVVFRFISKFFDKNKIAYTIIKRDNIITNIRIKKGGRISFVQPKDVMIDKKIDLILIDEAAVFPVTVLRKLFRSSSKKILLSTIHGYEGSGRSFQLKIIEPLKRQKGIDYKKYTLNSPIRFLDEDKIEKFLNFVFFLEAEAPKPPDDHSYGNISFKVYSEPELLLSEKGYRDLEEHIGILINSHYKNQPNDLMILTDSRSHFLIGLYSKTEDRKYLLVSGQLSYEGIMRNEDIERIRSGEYLEGNLIPILAVRHFSEDFCKLKGVRIVRIAAHPELIGKGFGRKMLDRIIAEFKTLDWIGVSFGASIKLVKFWRKFGFKAVQIRPVQTSTTGEWNLVMIYPISYHAMQIINRASQDFIVQFIELLRHSIHTMSYELVREIMYSCELLNEYKPNLTTSGHIRILNYVKGNLNFLMAIDAIYELTKAYFLAERSYALSKSQEGLLISRVLQSRTWGQTKGRTGLDWSSSQALMRKALTKIVKNITQFKHQTK